MIVGCAVAVLTVRFPLPRALLSPLLRVIRAAPVASFIILALVWIRTDRLPAFIAFLMVVPVVWANVERGIRETDERLLEMAAVFRMSWWKTLLRVRIPSVMPYFLTACTTGLGFAWKSGIAAEVICRPAASIGRQLQDAKTYLGNAGGLRLDGGRGDPQHGAGAAAGGGGPPFRTAVQRPGVIRRLEVEQESGRTFVSARFLSGIGGRSSSRNIVADCRRDSPPVCCREEAALNKKAEELP